MFLIVSMLLMLVGYLIAVKKQLWLIANYDPNGIQDKEGFGKFVGISLLVLLLPDSTGPLAGSFMGVIIGITIVMCADIFSRMM